MSLFKMTTTSDLTEVQQEGVLDGVAAGRWMREPQARRATIIAGGQL